MASTRRLGKLIATVAPGTSGDYHREGHGRVTTKRTDGPTGTLVRMGEPQPILGADGSQQALLEEMLRHQVGIDPCEATAVTDLAAVGIVNSTWRNSPVEDWHAGGRLSDGDMLRVNSYSTCQVQEIVRRWRTEVGITDGSGIAALDAIGIDEIDQLVVRIGQWLVNPGRRLPTGATLGELAGDDLSEFAEHVEDALDDFAATAEDIGARHALSRAAVHAGLACRHWWGAPAWSTLVDRFIRALDDPDDPHWGPDPASLRIRLVPEPAQVIDRARLRQLLLDEPWQLEATTARWIINAGIGFLRPALPPVR